MAEYEEYLTFAIDLAKKVRAFRTISVHELMLLLPVGRRDDQGRSGKTILPWLVSGYQGQRNWCEYPWSGTRIAAHLLGWQLVTEVDQAVEAFISKTISEKYPTHKLWVLETQKSKELWCWYAVNSIGEETYAAEGKMELTEEFTWIVDPIDGEHDSLSSYGAISAI
jgi:hypothetical protein